jgi:CheY-like chemotaxis protein
VQSGEVSRQNIDFVANISHELRTPMNAIIGMVELALKEQLSSTVRHYLQTAKDSADVLLRLLNDILDFSKMDAGGFALDCTPFSLRATVDDAVKAFAAQAYQKGLQLACQVSSTVPDGLIGDPVRLRQVLTNLLGNAIKFTARGEVVVYVAMESSSSEEVCLRFSVADTGIGISPEEQQRIFLPFIQADASTTRLFGGTGLGLAIVSELVSMMGGRLWVESAQGRGSVFHFAARFPFQRGLKPSIHDREIPLDMLRGVRVLVVCDNAIDRRIMEETLGSWSMRPLVVDSAPAALAELETAARENQEIPLVIVDPLGSGDEGFGLASPLSGQSQARALILATSPAERQMLCDRCRGLRIAAHLDKPILQSGLLDAVLTALSGVNSAATVDRTPPDGSGRLHVLLAEDVPANQEVVRSILVGRGHTVRVAWSGEDAVAWFRREPFDLVLMDVQMPGMDGFQATAAIRALEPPGRRVPILALTAHALPGDRERCLLAGMDDYLAKPLDVAEVLAMTQRYTGGPRLPQEPQDPGPAWGEPPTEDEWRRVEPVFYPRIALARLRGNRGLLEDLARMFLEDCRPLLEQLHRAWEARDGQTLMRSAHSLKGLAANFEALDATEAARRVEQLGRDGPLEGGYPLIERLDREIQRLSEALRRVVPEPLSAL